MPVRPGVRQSLKVPISLNKHLLISQEVSQESDVRGEVLPPYITVPV